MANDKIKIAIAGLGKMGRYHLNAIQALQRGEYETYYKGDSHEVLSRIEVAGICDISAIGKQLPDGTRVYTDYKEMLNTGVDLLIIATPTTTHYEIARFALEKGIHIFVEKPIVTKSSEFEQLLEITDDKKLKIMAGHVERYNPVSLKLRELLWQINENVEHFEFRRIQQHDPRIPDDIIVDKLIHDLDLSLFLFGGLKKYEILEHKLHENQVYELRIATEHENGSGEIFVSWLKQLQPCRQVNLKLANQQILGDLLTKTLKLGDESIKCDVPRWIEAENNQVKDELVDFIVHCFSNVENLPGTLLTLKEIECTVGIIEEISNLLTSNKESKI